MDIPLLYKPVLDIAFIFDDEPLLFKQTCLSRRYIGAARYLL
jgi:hypothetical protein